jgi:ribonucleoside-diphosphate reductase alpha chain
MYLETRDIDEVMNIYSAAWEKGLKTTYYLHMKPRHTAEQSTVSVNKAQSMGKLGFGALRAKATTSEVVSNVETNNVAEVVETEVKVPTNDGRPAVTVHVSEDPQDALICESCQ